MIGKPYKSGGDGPHEFDCYGLAAHVLRGVFGVNLPPRAVGALSAYRGWRQIDQPMDGALVMLTHARGRHVGVYLAREGGVIHALEECGVVFDDMQSLGFRGLGQPAFWVHQL
nr:NlpC/P60 family protein [Rhodoblastus acidophilus]